MPQIREYDAQVSAQGPLPGRSPERLFASGEDFASPGLQNFGKGLESAATTLYDTAQRQEVSDVSARLSQARQQWTIEMQKRAVEAPAGDPNFASKFTQDFTDYMAKAGEGISTEGGRRAFQRGSAELAAHLIPQAGAQQVHLAGVKAVADFRMSQDSNTGTLQRDPTQFMSILNDTVANLNDRDGIYAKMPAADRERLLVQAQEGLAQAAARGMISKNPQAALKMLEDGTAPWSDYLKGIQPSVLKGEAHTAIRGQEIEQMRLEAAAEKAARQASEAAENRYIADIFSGAPKATAQQIATDPALKPGTKLTMLAVMERQSREVEDKVITQPGVATDVFQRIHADWGDPRKITDASQIEDLYSKWQILSAADMQRYRKEFQDSRTDEGEKFGKRQADFFKAIEPQIDKSNPLQGSIDMTGKANMYRFMYDVQRKVADKRKANEDPNALFDPASPEYVGKPEALEPYTKTIAQSTATITQNLRRGVPAISAPVPPAEDKRPPLSSFFGK